MLAGSSMVAFAAQEDDLLQYIYLFPVNDYSGLGDLMQKRADYDQSLSGATLLPYSEHAQFHDEERIAVFAQLLIDTQRKRVSECLSEYLFFTFSALSQEMKPILGGPIRENCS